MNDHATDHVGALLADREQRQHLVTSYADAVAHLGNAIRILTRIGGHMTSEDQAALREARAFLKAAT